MNYLKDIFVVVKYKLELESSENIVLTRRDVEVA